MNQEGTVSEFLSLQPAQVDPRCPHRRMHPELRQCSCNNQDLYQLKPETSDSPETFDAHFITQDRDFSSNIVLLTNKLEKN